MPVAIELFDTAKAAQRRPLDEIEALFASELYEARMGALCILPPCDRPWTSSLRPSVPASSADP